MGEYIAYGQQNALDGAWMKQLENASARVHISRLEAIKLQIQQQAERLYAEQLDFVDRAARDPDGTTAKVPADMSFEEWKRRFI